MNTTDKAQVNSRPWWEDYFANQWDANNGRGQTTYFMQRLVENLPPAEREYLASGEVSILDWGCAFGDGVEVLAEAFPRCRVAGLDFAERAVAEARRCFPQHDFRHTPDGAIGDHFDVIVCSHCLEHFSDPLQVLRQHLRCCRGFYALLVPYKESPLIDTHIAQFREESFPERLEGFTRIAAKVVDSDPSYWPDQMLLVAYASASYLSGREGLKIQVHEREKWDNYYTSLSLHEIDDSVRKFGEELTAEILKFLPSDSTVLEAGCGAGWQSMILAESGKLKTTLMDFSPEALKYAQRAFEHRGLSAEYLCQNVFMPGKEEFDLVFNAGVLEHYSFDEQVAFLRGMASRSRKFVLALVPNPHCYWYWIWRIINAARGNWPYGKETPLSNLSAAFEAAGLTFVGEWFGGSDWSEDFITTLPGLNDELREHILAVHRSSIIPARQRGYLVAALGCKEHVTGVPSCWDTSSGSSDFTLDQITASLADSLAAVVAAEHRCKQSDIVIANQEKTCDSLREDLRQSSTEIVRLGEELGNNDNRLKVIQELSALKSSRGYRLLQRFWRIRSWIAPSGSRRESASRLLLSAARRWRTPLATLKHCAQRAPRLRLLHRIRNAAAIGRDGWEPISPVTDDTKQPPLVPGLVSVVLPVYNHAHLLRQAVESVLAQRYRRLELIIVNDGSTDGVEKVLAEYAGHPLVRVLTQPNQGLPKALSNGFEFARGEFWTWTSADNLMHPDQLRLEVKYLQTHDKAVLVYADYTAINAKGRPLSDPEFRPHNRRSPRDPVIHLPDADSFGQTADNFIGPCFLYRGQAGRLLGEYEPIMGIEDFDYWLRMSLIGQIAHLDSDRPLYRYRVHDESLSGQATELQIPQRATQLIDNHRSREDFFAKPWIIHADEATLKWLNKTDVGPHQVVPWDGQRVTLQDGEKRLMLLHADNLPTAAKSNREAGVVLAAWFPADPHAPDRFRTEAQGALDLCFAKDDATLNRLALLTPNVFRAEPGSTMVSLATKWADSRTLDKADLPASERERTLPSVFRAQQRPTSVLLQADGFTQGGMEQVVIDLATSLRAEHFDVSLLVLGEQGSDAERVRQAGIPVLSLPEENRELHYRRLLQERRIDLVNAHYSLFGAQIATEAGKPFVQTIHNTYIFLPPDQIEAYRANDSFTSAYVCVSQMAAHYSDIKLGLPTPKMVVVPNGIDLQRLDAAMVDGVREKLRLELGLAPDDFVFLNVSSLQPIKCQAVLVRAFAEVVRDYPKAKLVLVGRDLLPNYRQQVDQAIADNGLENAVLLVGHRDDAMQFYAAADAFVLPSLCEGWSLAMAEALGAGLPVAATVVGSAPDLLPRFGGQLIRTPFGKMTNLDFLNLDEYVRRDDPQVRADLTAAMAKLIGQPSRQPISAALWRELDCREAYKPYGQLFLWLLQGGHPSAARPWATARLASSNTSLPVDAGAAEEQAAATGSPIHQTDSRNVFAHNSEVEVDCDVPGTPLQYRSVSSMPFRVKRLAGAMFPAATRRGRLVRAVAESTRRVQRRIRHGANMSHLADVLREVGDHRGIVIYPPLIDWTWMRQRPHQLMTEFAKAGYLSLFCSPQNKSDSFQGFSRVAERLYLCESVELIRDVSNPIMLISWVDHWEILKQFSSPLVIYDYLDSLSVSSPNGDPAPQKLDWHNKLVAQSDIVLATAKHLYEEVHHLRPDTIYCPNGVEYDHFSLSAAPPVPGDIADLVASGRPIIGYFGAFARWFDYELVAHTANTRRDHTFLLIGPDFDGTMAASRIMHLPNVRWLGEKQYEDLPSYLHYFSVATIPFLINEITQSTSPVKLFEYMAGGKPIITTDLPECRKYSCVMVAHDADEYTAMLDEAVHRGKSEEYRRELDREARNNTWQRRTEQIINSIDYLSAGERRRSA